MDRKSTLIIVLLLALALVFFLVILFTRSSVETAAPSPETASTTEWLNTPAEQKTVLVTPKTTITAKHAYQNGTHIVAGEVPLPTTCHILDASGAASSDKKQVLVTLASSIKTGETCLDNITPARFKVSVKALKGARVSGTLNGQEIILNLIEAGPDENLDNFELYIKG
jgi:hypothetical protein